MPWDTNPLYAIMHESIYCCGGSSNWAAHRVREVSKGLHASVTDLRLLGKPANGGASYYMSHVWITSVSHLLCELLESGDMLV